MPVRGENLSIFGFFFSESISICFLFVLRLGSHSIAQTRNLPPSATQVAGTTDVQCHAGLLLMALLYEQLYLDCFMVCAEQGSLGCFFTIREHFTNI
jgi:hypothetical protein